MVAGQSPVSIWGGNGVSFKTVKLKIIDEKRNTIYDGLKDCSIEISGVDNDAIGSVLDMKLSGYFEMKYGIFSEMEYKIDKDGGKKITYSFKSESTFATIQLIYDLGEEKPHTIYVAVSEHLENPKEKSKVYILSGLE